VKQQDSGNAKILGEIFGNFGLAMLTAWVFICAVLTLLFNNFLHPLAIMTALPFSIGGVLLGLLVSHKELGLFALIGTVLLLGLVSKNAILLVDYALIHRHEGKPTYFAVRLQPLQVIDAWLTQLKHNAFVYCCRQLKMRSHTLNVINSMSSTVLTQY